MTLADLLGVVLRFREALAAGLLIALVAALVATPRTMSKLRGAGITGNDIHKHGRPEVPEMGGLAVFLAFNVGAFTVLGFGNVPQSQEALILASLVVAAGACITGVLDDLVVLRQRFKAFIPFAFAAPLALYVPGTTVVFPLVGPIDFGILYPLVLVPLGIASASNGFNMLEGFNGLGAGLGIIMATVLSVMSILTNELAPLAILFPLIGALGGFLWFNAFPSRVFPGDTMTLLVGAALGAAVILGGFEFWGALLFSPHVVEFFLKASGGFKAESFATGMSEEGELHYVGRIQSIPHIVMKHLRVTEGRLVLVLWAAMAVYGLLIVAAFAAWQGGAELPL